MAFKPRDKNTNGDNKFPNKDGIEVVSTDPNGKPKAKQFPYTDSEIKTFRDQAIHVLNILDSKGINIYDENRKPGMYLRDKKGHRKNIIENILAVGDSTEGQFEQQKNTSETTNKLLDFFK